MKSVDPIKIFIIFISSFFIIYGVFKFTEVISFLKNSEVTTGEIVGYKIIMERHDGWQNYKYPEVNFINKNTGEEVIGVSIYADKEGKSKVGEKVTIHYNKSNPNEVIIDSLTNIWYVPITSVAGGFFMIFVYLINYVFKVKNYINQ